MRRRESPRVAVHQVWDSKPSKYNTDCSVWSQPGDALLPAILFTLVPAILSTTSCPPSCEPSCLPSCVHACLASCVPLARHPCARASACPSSNSKGSLLHVSSSRVLGLCSWKRAFAPQARRTSSTRWTWCSTSRCSAAGRASARRPTARCSSTSPKASRCSSRRPRRVAPRRPRPARPAATRSVQSRPAAATPYGESLLQL